MVEFRRGNRMVVSPLPPLKYGNIEYSSFSLFRAYFELKREHIKTCKRDELLGLNICENKKIDTQRRNAEEVTILNHNTNNILSFLHFSTSLLYYQGQYQYPHR